MSLSLASVTLSNFYPIALRHTLIPTLRMVYTFLQTPLPVRPSALTATGFIWVRYSFVIIPVNYSLAAVRARRLRRVRALNPVMSRSTSSSGQLAWVSWLASGSAYCISRILGWRYIDSALSFQRTGKDPVLEKFGPKNAEGGPTTA